MKAEEAAMATDCICGDVRDGGELVDEVACDEVGGVGHGDVGADGVAAWWGRRR